MAKKKKSATQQLIQTPFSLKHFFVLVFVGAGFLYLNISVFSKQAPIEKTEIPRTITQSDLQNVLGSTISLGEIPRHDNDSTENDQVTLYWQSVIEQNPNYPDAYIILAIQAFNKRDCKNTRYYLDKAYSLDPNNTLLQENIPRLKTCLETQQ